MGGTIQVRNVDPDVRESLKKLARSEGLSLSEYLRRALTRIADRQRVQERWDAAVARHEDWVQALHRTPRPQRGDRPVEGMTTDAIARAIQEDREERTDRILAALGIDSPGSEDTDGDRDRQ